jgi:hypothetical protein
LIVPAVAVIPRKAAMPVPKLGSESTPKSAAGKAKPRAVKPPVKAAAHVAASLYAFMTVFRDIT